MGWLCKLKTNNYEELSKGTERGGGGKDWKYDEREAEIGGDRRT